MIPELLRKNNHLYGRKKRSRKEFNTTVSELHAIAPAQNAGSSNIPLIA